MFIRWAVCGLLVLGASHAYSKTAPPNSDYQAAVLAGFKSVADGSQCSSSGSVSAVDDRTVSTSSSCSSSWSRRYTIIVGQQIFILEPTLTGKQTAKNAALTIGTLGYGALFIRQKDVLSNQLPGANILIRSIAKGFEIKVGKKESAYLLVGAE